MRTLPGIAAGAESSSSAGLGDPGCGSERDPSAPAAKRPDWTTMAAAGTRTLARKRLAESSRITQIVARAADAAAPTQGGHKSLEWTRTATRPAWIPADKSVPQETTGPGPASAAARRSTA